MTVPLPTVDVAQCATCGGLLVPAGDDWRHEADTACTAFGTPVICRHSDCGFPAAVGALACQVHTGLSHGLDLYGRNHVQ